MQSYARIDSHARLCPGDALRPRQSSRAAMQRQAHLAPNAECDSLRESESSAQSKSTTYHEDAATSQTAGRAGRAQLRQSRERHATARRARQSWGLLGTICRSGCLAISSEDRLDSSAGERSTEDAEALGSTPSRDISFFSLRHLPRILLLQPPRPPIMVRRCTVHAHSHPSPRATPAPAHHVTYVCAPSCVDHGGLRIHLENALALHCADLRLATSLWRARPWLPRAVVVWCVRCDWIVSFAMYALPSSIVVFCDVTAATIFSEFCSSQPFTLGLETLEATDTQLSVTGQRTPTPAADPSRG
jgi:hypothetical protein